ncbi:hypothetical protein OSC52_09440 [Clostridium pasteurianum]|uniref:hypothetical protein n=1 Tax=Clostridium pasteurianum TaxID=1501 RepID=UPI002260A53B|nr:hypothetical protein [Clostridium pasteurianum]UZW16018.1 hypothetical protein OSC52_09440 [Clostridium pasteurianum]
MGRKKLEWYRGAMYHVTARGNRRSDLFKEEIDFEFYLKCMEEALSYYKDCYRITLKPRNHLGQLPIYLL